MNKSISIFLIMIAIALVSIFIVSNKKEDVIPNEPVSNQVETAIRAKVVEFGTKLKQEWQASSSMALGRNVSSPWPERIDVVSITKLDSDTYKVEGNVIEITNADRPLEAAAVYPVSLTVKNVGGTWLISAVTKGAYSELPTRVTKTGLWECLPHKNTTGPQTEECTLGLAADQSDAHYALDLHLLEAQPVDLSTGTHVRVEGVLTPGNQLSSNTWQKYPIDGIISVTSIQKI